MWQKAPLRKHGDRCVRQQTAGSVVAGAYKYVLAVNEQSMLSVKELSHLDYGNINHTTSHEAAVDGAMCLGGGCS